MNKGGFSWKRLTGISSAKSRLSRATGIPLSRTGRQRKAGAAIGCATSGLIVIILAAAIPASLAPSRKAPGLLDYSVRCWQCTPAMTVQDAYKWLYHATLGGEHAISDESVPRRWLEEEWDSLTAPMKGEPMIVPLRPDGRLVRLNLRPYRAKGGDREALLNAFVASGRQFKGDRGDFIREWVALGERLRSGRVMSMTLKEWEAVDRKSKPAGYPAVHHSDAYEAAYRPAYRVLNADMARDITSRLQKAPH